MTGSGSGETGIGYKATGSGHDCTIQLRKAFGVQGWAGKLGVVVIQAASCSINSGSHLT